MDLEKYIKAVQAEIDAAQIAVYRYEGALAMLKKIQADQEAEKKETQEAQA